MIIEFKVFLLPSKKTTFSVRPMIPDLRAVSTAMYMLSPVIIFGYILDFINRFIVSHVSSFSLFSKAINPRLWIPYKYIYLSAFR